MIAARRVQFALNSENPEVVKKGLSECIDSICADDVSATDRLHLRSLHSTSSAPSDFVKRFLELSPHLEEFYLLWSLPSRLLDLELCTLHTVAFTLMVTSGETTTSRKALLSKLLKTYPDAIISQLQSPNSTLHAATISLLTWSVCCKCVVSEGIIEALQGSLIALKDKSKTNRSSAKSKEERVVDLCSERVAAMKFLASFLEKSADAYTSSRLLEDRRGLRAILTKLDLLDNEEEVRSILNDLLHVLSSQPKLLLSIDQILTAQILSDLANLIPASSTPTTETADDTVTYFLKKLVQQLGGLKERKIAASSAFLQSILTSLQPHLRPEHREIEKTILLARPTLLRKYLRKFQITPTSSPSEVISKLSHLTHLIEVLGLQAFLHHPTHSASTTSNHVEDDEDGHHAQSGSAGVYEILLLTVTDLSKACLTRLLLLSESEVGEEVASLTLSLLSSSLSLILQAHSNHHRSTGGDKAVVEDVVESLPDIATLLTLWQRWSTSSFLNPKNSEQEGQSDHDQTSNNHDTNNGTSDVMQLEDDIDIGIATEEVQTPSQTMMEGATEEDRGEGGEGMIRRREIEREARRSLLVHRFLYYLSALLSCTSLPNSLFSATSSSSALDAIKILETLLQSYTSHHNQIGGSSGVDGVSVSVSVSVSASLLDLVLEGVEVVSQASHRRLIKWFGSSEETNKTLAHAVTTGFEHIISTGKGKNSSCFLTLLQLYDQYATQTQTQISDHSDGGDDGYGGEVVRRSLERLLVKVMAVACDRSQGHGHRYEEENHSEYLLWIRYATSPHHRHHEKEEDGGEKRGKERMHTLDLLLRLSHHLQPDILHYLSSASGVWSHSSLVWSTAMLLYHGHFAPFLVAFPAYIQTRLTSSIESAAAFLRSTYTHTVRKEVAHYLSTLTPLIVLTHPSPSLLKASLSDIVDRFPNHLSGESDDNHGDREGALDLREVVGRGADVEAMLSAASASALIGGDNRKDRSQTKIIKLMKKMMRRKSNSLSKSKSKKRNESKSKKTSAPPASTSVSTSGMEWREVWYDAVLRHQKKGGEIDPLIDDVFQRFLVSSSVAVCDVNLLLAHLSLLSQHLLLLLHMQTEQGEREELSSSWASDRCHERLVQCFAQALQQPRDRKHGREMVVQCLIKNSLVGKALFQLSPFGLTCRQLVLTAVHALTTKSIEEDENEDKETVRLLLDTCHHHLHQHYLDHTINNNKEEKEEEEIEDLLFREDSSLHLLETLIKADLRRGGGGVGVDRSLLLRYCKHRLCSTPDLFLGATLRSEDEDEHEDEGDVSPAVSAVAGLSRGYRDFCGEVLQGVWRYGPPSLLTIATHTILTTSSTNKIPPQLLEQSYSLLAPHIYEYEDNNTSSFHSLNPLSLLLSTNNKTIRRPLTMQQLLAVPDTSRHLFKEVFRRYGDKVLQKLLSHTTPTSSSTSLPTPPDRKKNKNQNKNKRQRKTTYEEGEEGVWLELLDMVLPSHLSQHPSTSTYEEVWSSVRSLLTQGQSRMMSRGAIEEVLRDLLFNRGEGCFEGVTLLHLLALPYSTLPPLLYKECMEYVEKVYVFYLESSSIALKPSSMTPPHLLFSRCLRVVASTSLLCKHRQGYGHPLYSSSSSYEIVLLPAIERWIKTLLKHHLHHPSLLRLLLRFLSLLYTHDHAHDQAYAHAPSHSNTILDPATLLRYVVTHSKINAVLSAHHLHLLEPSSSSPHLEDHQTPPLRPIEIEGEVEKEEKEEEDIYYDMGEEEEEVRLFMSELESDKIHDDDIAIPSHSTETTLHLIHLLTVTMRKMKDKDNKDKVVEGRVEEVVAMRYEGRMTSVDHLILHILHTLTTPPTLTPTTSIVISLHLPNILLLHNHNLREREREREEPAHALAHTQHSSSITSSLDRLTSFLKPEVVHITLNAFPLHRGLHAQAHTHAHTPTTPTNTTYSKVYDPAFVIPAIFIALREIHSLLPNQRKKKKNNNNNNNNEEENEDEDEMEVEEREGENEDSEEDEEDEEVWRVLRRGCESNGVSRVRRLFSCGAVALLLMSQTSLNEEVRVMGRAGLAMLHDITSRLTAERDAAFRDRPNLLLLLDFLKHSLHRGQDLPMPTPMPTTSALFLARASLILLTSSNPLYSTVGSYLLSKPCYDVRDVPLLEQILFTDRPLTASLTSSATTSQQIYSEERAARFFVLRMIRDGLVTSSDHDNLVRKNVYSRLLILFHSLDREDHRFGLIILDIIDKAVSIPTIPNTPYTTTPCDYLLHSCHLLPWLSEVVHRMSITTSSTSTTSSSTSSTSIFLSSVINLLRHILARSHHHRSSHMVTMAQNYQHLIHLLQRTLIPHSVDERRERDGRDKGDKGEKKDRREKEDGGDTEKEREREREGVVVLLRHLCEECCESFSKSLHINSTIHMLGGRKTVEEAVTHILHTAQHLLISLFLTEDKKKKNQTETQIHHNQSHSQSNGHRYGHSGHGQARPALLTALHSYSTSLSRLTSLLAPSSVLSSDDVISLHNKVVRVILREVAEEVFQRSSTKEEKEEGDDIRARVRVMRSDVIHTASSSFSSSSSLSCTSYLADLLSLHSHLLSHLLSSQHSKDKDGVKSAVSLLWSYELYDTCHLSLILASQLLHYLKHHRNHRNRNPRREKRDLREEMASSLLSVLLHLHALRSRESMMDNYDKVEDQREESHDLLYRVCTLSLRSDSPLQERIEVLEEVIERFSASLTLEERKRCRGRGGIEGEGVVLEEVEEEVEGVNTFDRSFLTRISDFLSTHNESTSQHPLEEEREEREEEEEEVIEEEDEEYDYEYGDDKMDDIPEESKRSKKKRKTMK